MDDASATVSQKSSPMPPSPGEDLITEKAARPKPLETNTVTV